MSTDKPLNWLDHLKDGPQAHRDASDPPTYVDVPPFGLMELGADGTLRRDMGGPSFTVRYEPGDFEIKGMADEMKAPPLVYMGLPIHVADPMPAGVLSDFIGRFDGDGPSIITSQAVTANNLVGSPGVVYIDVPPVGPDGAPCWDLPPRSIWRTRRRRAVRLRARIRRAQRGWR